MGKAAKKRAQERHPGYSGAETWETRVRISTTRQEQRQVRGLPGSFEWRYNRDKANTALYHAGVHFAGLWEKAGTSAANSPGMEFVSNGGWKGMPDGRVVALDDLRSAMRDLGKMVTVRLVAYCVEGRTSREIADRFGIAERDMAPVLNADLVACAHHFHYLGNRG